MAENNRGTSIVGLTCGLIGIVFGIAIGHYYSTPSGQTPQVQDSQPQQSQEQPQTSPETEIALNTLASKTCSDFTTAFGWKLQYDHGSPLGDDSEFRKLERYMQDALVARYPEIASDPSAEQHVLDYVGQNACNVPNGTTLLDALDQGVAQWKQG